MKDRSDDPSHHERTLLPHSYISLLQQTRSRFYFLKHPSLITDYIIIIILFIIIYFFFELRTVFSYDYYIPVNRNISLLALISVGDHHGTFSFFLVMYKTTLKESESLFYLCNNGRSLTDNKGETGPLIKQVRCSHSVRCDGTECSNSVQTDQKISENPSRLRHKRFPATTCTCLCLPFIACLLLN